MATLSPPRIYLCKPKSTHDKRSILKTFSSNMKALDAHNEMLSYAREYFQIHEKDKALTIYFDHALDGTVVKTEKAAYFLLLSLKDLK